MSTKALKTDTEEVPARRFREAIERDDRQSDALARAMILLATDDRLDGCEKYELVMALKTLDRRSR